MGNRSNEYTMDSKYHHSKWKGQQNHMHIFLLVVLYVHMGDEMQNVMSEITVVRFHQNCIIWACYCKGNKYIYIYNSKAILTEWGCNKMVDVLQMKFSNAFSLNENLCTCILIKISLDFVFIKWSLVQAMAWHQIGAKPFLSWTMVQFTDACMCIVWRQCVEYKCSNNKVLSGEPQEGDSN